MEDLKEDVQELTDKCETAMKAMEARDREDSQLAFRTVEKGWSPTMTSLATKKKELGKFYQGLLEKFKPLAESFLRNTERRQGKSVTDFIKERAEEETLHLLKAQ